MSLPNIQSNSKEIVIQDFSGGVNYSEEPHKIRDNQLSDLCNMEYKSGVLSKRSGYETILQDENMGEILAVKKFRDKIYCAAQHAIVRIDRTDGGMEILAKNLNLTKPGSFIIKENLMYYFSGDGIYKMNPYISDFGMTEQSVLSHCVACELESGIYTDGNNIYNFNGYEPDSYSLALLEPVSFDHICCYVNPEPDANVTVTVYGVNKPNKLSGNVTITVIELSKEEFGYTVLTCVEYEAEMPLHHKEQYVAFLGIYIRYMDAVKGYLLFQCDFIVRTSSGVSYHDGYIPLVIKYDLATNAFVTDCGISNSTACYELYSKYNDETVITLKQDEKNSKWYLLVTNYETVTGKSISIKKMAIDYTSSTDVTKDHLTHITAIKEDVVLITYRKEVSTGTYVFASELVKILDSSIFVLAEANEVIDDLHRIGANFYELPIYRDFYSDIGMDVNGRIVTPYYFGNDLIEKGYDFVSEKDGFYGVYDFCRYDGKVWKLTSSEFSATKITGYVPVILEARYVTSSSQYETVSKESYNSLSRKARVRFIDTVSADVKSILLPIPYNDVESISTTGNGTVTFSKSGENTMVTKTQAFEIGEELIIISVDTGKTEAVSKCHLAVAYGGIDYTAETGSRIFAAGNENDPTTYYVSQVNNFEYFPELNYQMLEDGGQCITGFAKHYQDLIIFKDSSISLVSYDQEKTGATVRRVHDTIGCDMPGSIQIINNDVVFGNSEKGIFLLSIKDLSSERNINPIGLHISGYRGIDRFPAPEKKNARSIDFQNRYFLSVGDRIYIWDYELSPYNGYQDRLSWFEYRNISASCLFPVDEFLAFGTKGKFRINLFDGSYNDAGEAINSYFQTKAFDFGDGSAMKSVWQIWINLNSNRDMKMTLECMDENGMRGRQEISFSRRIIANTMTRRIKMKRILYFSVKLENEQLHTDYDVSGMKLEYEIYKSRR